MEHFYQAIPGFLWFTECYRRLLRALPSDTPSVFVELGAFMGRSTAWLGVEIVNSGKPVTLVTVDSFVSWEGDASILRGDALAEAFTRNTAPLVQALNGRFRPVRSDTRLAAQQFADCSVDVVFVDAGHGYEDVSADIEAWWPKIKPGGWMAGDDFMMRPVAQAVCERFAPDYILVHGWTDNPVSQPWPSWMVRRA